VDEDDDDARTKAKRRKQPTNKYETDEEDEPAKKKSRKSNGTNASASSLVVKKHRKASEPESDEVDEEDDKLVAVKPSTVAQYKNKDNWETFVDEIDTVERDVKGGLVVYFRMKKLSQPCVEPSDVCKKRFPQKLLTFYEKNLRWRSAETTVQEEAE